LKDLTRFAKSILRKMSNDPALLRGIFLRSDIAKLLN